MNSKIFPFLKAPHIPHGNVTTTDHLQSPANHQRHTNQKPQPVGQTAKSISSYTITREPAPLIFSKEIFHGVSHVNMILQKVH